MKRLRNIFKEKFVDGLKYSYFYVELHKNPTIEELNTFLDWDRGVLLRNGDLYVLSNPDKEDEYPSWMHQHIIKILQDRGLLKEKDIRWWTIPFARIDEFLCVHIEKKSNKLFLAEGYAYLLKDKLTMSKINDSFDTFYKNCKSKNPKLELINKITTRK